MAALETEVNLARFRHMVESEGPRLARLLLYLGVRAADLDDALQDTFLVAYRRWRELEQHGALGPWLRRVALNVARNHKRASRRSRVEMTADGELDAVDFDNPESNAETRQLQSRLLAALDQMGSDERRCFVLFEIEGVPMQEIAESLDTSLATAYRRLAAARTSLKTCLSKTGVDPSAVRAKTRSERRAP